MSTQRPRLVIALVTLLAVFGLPALILGASGVGTNATTSTASQAQPLTFAVQGTYVGVVKVSDVVAGHYTAALATPTPAPTVAPNGGKLGLELELSLYLTVTTGGEISGYVILDRSLVFPQVTIIQATPIGPTPLPGTPPPGATPLPIGPRVNGIADGPTRFTIESEPFTVVLAPERSIPAPVGGGAAPAQRVPEQRALRQFRLEGTLRRDGVLVGEYRETVQRTVENLPAPPSTAIGQFQLNPQAFAVAPTPRPTTPPPGQWRIYLPLLESAASRP